MKKISRIANWTTLLVCLTAIVFIYLYLDRSGTASDQLVNLTKELEIKKKSVLEAEKERDRDRLRETSRTNALLDEIKEQNATKVSLVNREIPEQERGLEAALQAKEATEAEQAGIRGEIAEIERQAEALVTEAQRLALANPNTETELKDLEGLIDDERARGDQLRDDLANYAEETETLAVHHRSIVAALQRDFHERPWIEPGETLITRIQKIHPGMLVLPLGKNDGLKDKMRFLVHRKGERLCQIRIKKANMADSVAMIIPMYGRVSRLRPDQTIEITNL